VKRHPAFTDSADIPLPELKGIVNEIPTENLSSPIMKTVIAMQPEAVF